MWRSQNGNIVLTGATRRIFSAGIMVLCDGLRYSAEPLEVGLGAFDSLERGQQAILLERVARAALLQEEEPPELPAAVEAAFVAAFLGYREILLPQIEDPGDIDPEIDPALNVVRRAAREMEMDGLPEDEAELEVDRWTAFLIELAERFMWDCDYRAWDQWADLPPERAATMRQMMGVGEDYFLWQPLDAAEEQVPVICKRTFKMVQAANPDERPKRWSRSQLQEVADQHIDDFSVAGRIAMPLHGREPIVQRHRDPRALEVLRRDRLGGQRIFVCEEGSEKRLFQIDIDADGTAQIHLHEPASVLIDREENLVVITLHDPEGDI